jgi:hypothetical protein
MDRTTNLKLVIRFTLLLLKIIESQQFMSNIYQNYFRLNYILLDDENLVIIDQLQTEHDIFSEIQPENNTKNKYVEIVIDATRNKSVTVRDEFTNQVQWYNAESENEIKFNSICATTICNQFNITFH